LDLEFLLVVGVAIVIGIPVAIIYLLVSNQKLKKRVEALEAARPRPSPAGSPWVAAKASVPPDEVQTEDATAPSSEPSPEPGPPQPTTTEPNDSPPKTVVLTGERLAALTAWLGQNWFYVVSAVSLALAGIFLVQYSIERGLLPPWARVTAALAFGLSLIATGEIIRRRSGDSPDVSTAYLPSTFSSAGIVTLFAGILSARTLYGLIGPEAALVGMGVVGVIALILGWFYGPLLAAIGVAGAMLAPFLVGGSSDEPSWLFAYFAIVTFVGLAIDTVRRWAWVSMLSLVLAYGVGFVLWASASRATEPFFILYLGVLAVLAIGVPTRRLTPNHDGSMLSVTLLARKTMAHWPEFPTRLAGGAVAATTALILFAAFDTGRADVFWMSVAIVSGLTLALLIWARNAPAISDLTLIPAAALVAAIFGGNRIWKPVTEAASQPEADMPLMVTGLVALGMVISGVAAWRSLRGAMASVLFAAGAALLAPAIAIAIEVAWTPAPTLGAYVWALHALAIAGMMVGLAERFHRADGQDDRLRMSLAVLSSLAAVAFAMVIVFSEAALTVALAVTVVAAAWLDRRFNLPLMGVYILVGVATLGVRLVAFPGLDWAFDAPIGNVLLSYGGALVALGAAWWMSREVGRSRTSILLESAVFSTSGLLLSVLLFRGIDALAPQSDMTSHWSLGLVATIWIVLGLGQLKRLDMGGALRVFRIVMGSAFLAIGALQLLATLTWYNPLLANSVDPVLGPIVINTLIPAYLLPALALGIGATWLKGRPNALRLGLGGLAALLGVFWTALVIRHFWRGGEAMVLPEIAEPELYTYTVALLLAGSGLFYQSLARRDARLRKAGLAVIGLSVAKVFLIDIAGLGGLIRVFALMLLGLSLAGLAWLNRWASGKDDQKPTDKTQ